MKTLLLASGSPRRRALLRGMGVRFRAVSPRFVSENSVPGESPFHRAGRLAREKARTVSTRYPGAWILSADTVVALGDRVFGKPVNREQADEFLRALSGRMHRVITGVVLAAPGGRIAASHVETTFVTFRKLGLAERSRYLLSGEAYDKAGGYALQGQALGWVRGFSGDYFNVVGLPLGWVAGRLSMIGFL